MKDKPLAHKIKNTFHFLTFAEHLKDIKIDVIRQSAIGDNPKDVDTFFQETLEKWVDLNYTEDFAFLFKEIGSEIQSLSQIVFRQDEIVRILLHHLQKHESMALDAILELIVALARDLQIDFYPYFPKLFVAVAQHLHTREPEVIEKIFVCLSYLFKFLWRYMVKDMENVYRLFSCLLDNSNKEYIRNFAAESFAFLSRKVPDKPKFFMFILKTLEENPEQVLGLGQLLFEVLKGVKKKFHSCAEEIFHLLLTYLGPGLNSEVEEYDTLPWVQVELALTEMLQSMAKHTEKGNVDFVQNNLCETIQLLLNNISVCHVDRNTLSVEHLDRILHLFLFWVQYKNGTLIQYTEEIIQVLTNLCMEKTLPDSCINSTVNIISSICSSSCIDVPVEKSRSIISLVYGVQSKETIFSFTRKMITFNMFEKDVLPYFLAYCMSVFENGDTANDDILEILAEIIVTLKPLPKFASDIKGLSKVNLSTANIVNSGCIQGKSSLEACQVLHACILDILQESKRNLSLDILPKLWYSLVCSPHLRFLDVKLLIEVIESIVILLCDKLMDPSFCTSAGDPEKLAFVLCQSIISWIYLNPKESISVHFSAELFTSLLQKFPKCMSVLRATEIFLFHSSIEKKSEEAEGIFKIILFHLLPNLYSPFHNIRVFTLRILCLFDLPLKTTENGVTPKHNVFSYCLEAENTPVNVQDYRGRLKWLRNLEYAFVVKNIPEVLHDECLKAPVYYLLGTLCINFKLLWKPAIELLESFAHGLNKKFWDIFHPYLSEVVGLAERVNKGEEIGKDYQPADFEVPSPKQNLFQRNLVSSCQHSESPDILNHRNLLWKAMSCFPDVVEPRNKSIVPMLFRFIMNEVCKVDASVASVESVHRVRGIEESHINLENAVSDLDSDFSDDSSQTVEEHPRKKRRFSKRKSTISTLNDLSEQVFEKESSVKNLEFMEFKDSINVSKEKFKSEDVCEKEDRSMIKHTGRKRKTREHGINKCKGITKTLAVYLTLFTKFKNPKCFYQNDELQALYYELLGYHEAEIQKLAFDCIMTYNYNYLMPYKENFNKILDDKTFKTEVVLFSLDESNETIHKEHRMQLMPILMKILHGKMVRKTGSNTAGKAQANTRRSIVLRFLAGCRAEELRIFLDLVFSPYKELVKSRSILSVIKNIRQNIDMSSIVPLRKQHSALNTLGAILQHVGSLVPEILPVLLKILLIIATTSSTLLEKREDVLPHCISLLKSIRTLAIMKIIQFFKSFGHYAFSPEEVDAIFEAIVWPMLSRIEVESVHQPSPLLRLFATWSDNSRFFVFFTKHHETTQALTPLPHLMSLYTSPQVHPRIVNILSQMLDQFLTVSDYDPKENQLSAPEVAINNCLPLGLCNNSGVNEYISFGTMMLLPHSNLILKRLKAIALDTAKNPKQNLSSRDLNIILRISEHVKDPEQCFELKELLIPFLIRPQKLNEDCEVAILSTIRNLMRYIVQPNYCTRSLRPLFSTLSHLRSRMALVEIFRTMAERNSDLQQLSDLAFKINAWNPMIMGEPDFETRSNGYAEAQKIINSITETIDEDIIAVIIHTSAYTIRSCDDTFLRDSSSHLLQQLGKKFSELLSTYPESFRVLVFDIFLPEIVKGFKSKAERVLHEFIHILSTLLHHCGSHPRLENLAALCDKDQDMDFWENITHPQVHRRARALLRVSNSIESGVLSFHPHVLKLYILPIVCSFLFDNVYQKHIHVVDAAIETLGSIARTLSWSRYEHLLRFYLGLLVKSAEHHKTIVKIIVAILNAFHFDLSASREIKSGLVEPPLKKAKRKVPEDSVENKDENMVIDLNVDTDMLGPVAGENEEMKDCTMENDLNLKDEEKATKICSSIVKGILPQLHRSLMQKTKNDSEHKLAVEHFYPEDEEILRVPIALAMVKLLQNLPHDNLKVNLPGLFLKICNLLKSRAESIRETARETLIKMMQSLGPSYFWYLLNEMRSVLTKGYQVHVMTFTINAVLTNLKDYLNVGDLDLCLNKLSEVCINELFSDVAEEKEVTKITGKLKEARSTKSYSIYQILGKFLSESYLSALVHPLQQILKKTYSHKKVRKVQECFRHISLGLSENKGISSKAQLIFIHVLITDGLFGLQNKSKTNKPEIEPKYVRPNTHLIPKAPPRGGIPAKMNVKTNDYVVTEFGLQLLQLCAKRDKLEGTENESLEMLDPFVPLLTNCLDSSHVKIISVSLRCLIWIFKFPVPSMKSNITSIVNFLFILINKYAGEGLAQGDNFEMVVMCFKMMTALVRNADYYKLGHEQLSVLLSYVAQDIHNFSRQATAFTLLKAILSKKLDAPELTGIMNKIFEMSINSEQEHVRTQCRQISLQYLLDYPLGKKIEKTLIFYVAQLDYSYEQGRISAIEMINAFIKAFPMEEVKKYSNLFFVPLASRLVNDDSSNCRKMGALAIKNILTKIDNDGKTRLFSIPSSWLESKKMSHQRLGVQCCSLFAEVEGDDFTQHLGEFLPALKKLLEAAKSENVESLIDERCTDHFIFHLLNGLLKVFSSCQVIRNEKYTEYFSIWEQIQQLILHPHLWVRFAACQLYGLLFSKYPVDEVVALVINQEESDTLETIFASRQKLRDLSADFATQLQSPYLNEKLGDQVIKNLVYLAKVIHRLPKQSSPDDVVPSQTTVSLEWMLRKLCREIKSEISQSANNSIKRNCIFKFLAAVALDLGEEKLFPMLPIFLTPLCRELADSSQNTDQSLKILAQEVIDIIRNVIGIERFTSEYANVQSAVFKKKAKRKREKIVEAVTAPQKFAFRKIKKQLDKKERKKKKISSYKGRKSKK